MYWKEIPVQVSAEDASEQVSQPLDDRFQLGVDTISMFDGSEENDNYLMAWEWGFYFEMEGTAKETASKIANQYNNQFPKNFVDRIRNLHHAGRRNPTPGAIDHWMNATSA